MGGHGGSPRAAGGQYRPAASAHRAPEFSLQGPIEIGALRATLSFRVAFEPKDSYTFARGQNIGIILPKPKELFELFGFEAKKRVRTATKN